MRRKKLTIVLLTLALTLALLPMSAFAAQRDVVEGSKASITVNDAVENDVLAAYKVIDITYDENTNSLSYAWNSHFADYFAACTIEQFAALASDSDALKNLLAGLPKYIAERSIHPVDTQTVAADGTATFAGLAMGEYFIRPTSTTSVYQLMLQKIEPTIVGGKYVIDDVTFAVKKVDVNVTKKVDKKSVTKGEKVTYTVRVDIPTYAANATDKSFYVSDLLPDGLTLDTGSIKAQIDGDDVNSAYYTLDKIATGTYTFKLSISKDQYASYWAANGGKQLVITYNAKFNNNDTTAVNTKETNTVTFDYSSYPYVENPHKQKTDTADVTTFAIKIDKYKNGSESTKLAGAKFDLYRTATSAEIDADTAVTIPHTSVQGIKLEGDLTTNNNGVAIFAKYEANGTKYDYYLVETQAPTGYNKLDKAVKFKFTAEDVKDTAGVYTVHVSNSDGFTLPVTGGTGTVIFTLIGIVLMAGAVALFVISRIKNQS